jgi:hypothetical protein
MYLLLEGEPAGVVDSSTAGRSGFDAEAVFENTASSEFSIRASAV